MNRILPGQFDARSSDSVASDAFRFREDDEEEEEEEEKDQGGNEEEDDEDEEEGGYSV